MADTIIIGAGLAGLTAANYLQQRGQDFLLLEADAEVGGRVKTTEKDGFLLDHGFQVFATAYPEAKALLDYGKLDLRAFLPGAMLLQADGSIDRIGDPLRDMSSLFPTLFAKVGGLGNKLGILSLRNRLKGMTLDAIFAQAEKSTEAALREDYGFSELMVERFFRPFYSGIFLEKELKTSRRMFDFVFKMFAEGEVAVPNKGMQQIPLQLAGNLPPECLRLQTRVQQVEGNSVVLKNGERLTAKNIILATKATDLIQQHQPNAKTDYVSTTHVHFTAPKAPFQRPLIALDTKPNDLVNSIAVMNKVAPGYSSSGQAMLSVSIVGKTEQRGEALANRLKEECRTWFGSAVDNWTFLDERLVEYALPNQVHVQQDANFKLGEGLYAIGDYALNGSINAAMRAGRLVAEQIG
jgi:phytoene dehydrogenase-like protein